MTDAHGRIFEIPPVPSNTISHAKGKGMSIHSVTPNQAVVDDYAKLTILADNLPRAGDLWVMFSTQAWSMKVRPDYQHNNSAVQLTTPKLYADILEKTKVEMKLVRISNQAETDPVDFFFLPDKKVEEGPRNHNILEGMLTDKGTAYTSLPRVVPNNINVNNGCKNIMINCKYT